MTAAAPAPLATVGQTVIYHGSIRWMHGPMTYVGPCFEDCPDCRGTNHRLVVAGTDTGLECVSPNSFTTIVPPSAVAAFAVSTKE